MSGTSLGHQFRPHRGSVATCNSGEKPRSAPEARASTATADATARTSVRFQLAPWPAGIGKIDPMSLAGREPQALSTWPGVGHLGMMVVACAATHALHAAPLSLGHAAAIALSHGVGSAPCTPEPESRMAECKDSVTKEMGIPWAEPSTSFRCSSLRLACGGLCVNTRQAQAQNVSKRIFRLALEIKTLLD